MLSVISRIKEARRQRARLQNANHTPHARHAQFQLVPASSSNGSTAHSPQGAGGTVLGSLRNTRASTGIPGEEFGTLTERRKQKQKRNQRPCCKLTTGVPG